MSDQVTVRLSRLQLMAARDAVSYAGYPYFENYGPEFVNDLLAILAAALKDASAEASKPEAP